MVGFLIFLTAGSGILLSLQKLINASLGIKVGSMESSFINHLVGAVFSFLLLLVGLGVGSIYFKGIPFYYFLGGSFGVFLVYFINFSIPQIGAMATLIFLIFSQLVVSSIIDHFGVFGGFVDEFNVFKALGIVMIMIGAFFVLNKKRRVYEVC